MVGFVNDNLAELDTDGKAKLTSIIAALSAEAGLASQSDADKKAEQDGTFKRLVAADGFHPSTAGHAAVATAFRAAYRRTL